MDAAGAFPGEMRQEATPEYYVIIVQLASSAAARCGAPANVCPNACALATGPTPLPEERSYSVTE